MPDLLMSVEIPRGSLGVPKHQRDCVPPAKVFHYRVPSFQFPPPRSTTVHSTRKPIWFDESLQTRLKTGDELSLARHRFNRCENLVKIQ